MSKKLLLTTGALVATAAPLVAALSCSALFEERNVLEEGNFEFEYITDDTPFNTENFNTALTTKDKFLFGSSLGAGDVYNTPGEVPDVIGIAPNKSLVNNGVFMSSAFSKNDMEAFSYYLQTLWWASQWRTNTPNFSSFLNNERGVNVPIEATTLTVPGNAYEDAYLSDDIRDEKRTNSFANLPLFGIFNNTINNTYAEVFDVLDMQFPKIYGTDSTIQTSNGVRKTHNGNSSNIDVLKPTMLKPYHEENGEKVEFDFDHREGLIENDIKAFLNIYAPYTYANYKPFTKNDDFENDNIRLVFSRDSVDPAYVSSAADHINKFANILINDQVPVKDIKFVDEPDSDTRREIIQGYLQDPDYRTIAVMPINDWSYYDNVTSSLVATYRSPVTISSLNASIDEFGHVALDGSSNIIDESYSLGLINAIFNIIDKPTHSPGVQWKKYNYQISELQRAYYLDLRALGTDEENKLYFAPLYEFWVWFDFYLPKSEYDTSFKFDPLYDSINHKIIDDVEPKYYSEGVNPFIYYSTSAIAASPEIDFNSRSMETEIVNNHGDGKINLRNEFILPVNIALNKADKYGDANIIGSVESWIRAHFYID